MGHEGDHTHADHPGHFHHRERPMRRDTRERAFTVGVGGPVGSGKTALVLALCRRLRDRLSLGVVTNDIFTREDAEFLVRNEALPTERIRAVETGGCPHAAIREDISHNLLSLERLMKEVRPRPSCSSSRAGATTWPRSTAASWPTSPSTSSTWPAGTRCRARAARASPSPTSW